MIHLKYGKDAKQNKLLHEQHLKEKQKQMKDYLVGIPDNPACAPDRSRERLTPAQAATVLKCIVLGKPKPLAITCVSPVMKEEAGDYIMVDAEGYKLAFFMRLGQITNCFQCVTPSRKEYNAAIDSGDAVCNLMKIDDFRGLSRMIMDFASSDEPGRKVGVREVYVVVMDYGTDRENAMGSMYDKGDAVVGTGQQQKVLRFPVELNKAHARFHTREEAEAVAAKAQEYHTAKEKQLVATRKKK